MTAKENAAQEIIRKLKRIGYIELTCTKCIVQPPLFGAIIRGRAIEFRSVPTDEEIDNYESMAKSQHERLKVFGEQVQIDKELALRRL